MQQWFELLLIVACVLFALKTVFEIIDLVFDSFRGDGLVGFESLDSDDFEPDGPSAPITDPQMRIIRMIDDMLPRDMDPIGRFMLAMSIEEHIEAALIQRLSEPETTGGEIA